jgi:hypothetical protein
MWVISSQSVVVVGLLEHLGSLFYEQRDILFGG